MSVNSISSGVASQQAQTQLDVSIVAARAGIQAQKNVADMITATAETGKNASAASSGNGKGQVVDITV